MTFTDECIRSFIQDRAEQIERIFSPTRERYVTVIVRTPGDVQDELIVTRDPALGDIIATLRRAEGR